MAKIITHITVKNNYTDKETTYTTKEKLGLGWTYFHEGRTLSIYEPLGEKEANHLAQFSNHSITAIKYKDAK